MYRISSVKSDVLSQIHSITTYIHYMHVMHFTVMSAWTSKHKKPHLTVYTLSDA